MDERIAEIGRRALAGDPPNREQLLDAVRAAGDSPHDLLYQAHRVRTDRFGDQVKLCSIVAGKTGGCSEDCTWCAQSARASADCAPGRTGPADILLAAQQAAERDASSFGIVNSGRRPSERDLREVTEAVRRMASGGDAHMQFCASLGELTEEQAEQLVRAGVTRYNHNLETSRGFFSRVVTTHVYDDRIHTLQTARRAGMSLCCGGIFGLGESWADRVELALTLRDEVRPDVTPLNFLHPIAGTPLADATPLEPMQILKIIAAFRLAMPEVDLKVAGGREMNLRGLQSWMFYAGATSCLIGNYLTTLGREPTDDLQMIRDLGLRPVREFSTPAESNRQGANT